MEERKKSLRMRRARIARIVRMIESAFFIFIFILSISGIKKILDKPGFKVNEGVIERNIEKYLNKIDEEPKDRYVAWSSELPDFIKEDMEFADRNGLEIAYTFKDIKFIIYKYDDEWRTSFKHPNMALYTYDNVTDFSIYKTSNKNIVIYGYDNNRFCRTEIVEEWTASEILTYNKNIPLDFENHQLDCYTKSVGDYGLMIKDNSQEFIFYKNGEKISSTIFYGGQIDFLNMSLGILKTSDNKLYIMFIELGLDDKPHISFEFLAEDVSEIISNDRSLLSSPEEPISLPIFVINNEYYTYSAKDWEAFKNFDFQSIEGISLKMQRLDMDIVPIKDCFKEAEFMYEYGYWKSYITFNINGKDFIGSYRVNGYDTSVDIPEEILNNYSSKTVKSIDEFWETIEAIRNSYYDFYDHQGTFSPLYFFILLILCF